MTEKVMDVLFVIDATGSMHATLKAAHDKAAEIAISLRVSHADTNFRFGAVCYRDPIDCPSDMHEFMNFDSDVDKLVSFLSNIRACGGGDTPEDWAGAMDIALTKLEWRDGAKSIIWIADADAHGRMFCGYDSHQDQEPLLEPLVKEIASMRILFTGISLNSGCNSTFEQLKAIYDANPGIKFQYESQIIQANYGDGEIDYGDEEIVIIKYRRFRRESRQHHCKAKRKRSQGASHDYAVPINTEVSEEIGEKLKEAAFNICDEALVNFYG